ncbi:CPBP family intramembrane glutamic endopeptidase [Curtobacterium sp. MCSS17_005]|uniref:CPBP family intramembrane glutamic endopeptidase n=1 Tax=Curtobacterium sp. MCSS17_005 TaxID=2175641 RepID=UPI000DA82519|nr:CPBP family intramembrane glutamic endopeptidase [Curtobacterium sp. MCSS17_005]WIB32470.1 CPBP family intramembrane metalloprotease [Curtobacterium sp. MCSS17_005]
MTTPTTITTTTRPERFRRSIWVALVAVAVYVFLAAVVGNLFGGLAEPGDNIAEFVLSHYIALPIGIALAVLFVRWAGWPGVWSETPTPKLHPRRLWLIAIPVLTVVIACSNLAGIDWSAWSVPTVLLIVIGTLMVGLGEELYLRGVLLSAVRARHSELATLLVTSVVFGVAHVVGSLWSGLSPAFILFQVSALSLAGATYYWVRRVTGRLWVAVLVHAFSDCVLYLGSGAARQSDALAHDASGSSDVIVGWVQILLIVLTLLSVLSVVLEDRRNRNARRAAATAATA